MLWTINDCKLIELYFCFLNKQIIENDLQDFSFQVDLFVKEIERRLSPLERQMTFATFSFFARSFLSNKSSKKLDEEMFHLYPFLGNQFHLKNKEKELFFEEYRYCWEMEIAEISPRLDDENFRKKSLEVQLSYYRSSIRFFATLLARYLKKLGSSESEAALHLLDLFLKKMSL